MIDPKSENSDCKHVHGWPDLVGSIPRPQHACSPIPLLRRFIFTPWLARLPAPASDRSQTASSCWGRRALQCRYPCCNFCWCITIDVVFQSCSTGSQLSGSSPFLDCYWHGHLHDLLVVSLRRQRMLLKKLKGFQWHMLNQARYLFLV